MSAFRIPWVALGAFVASLIAVPSGADVAAWDQARATEIAGKLAKAADGFEQAIRQQPDQTVGSGDAQAFLKLQYNSRVLREQSMALAGHLKAGKGHDDTKNLYRDMKELADDTANNARQADLLEPTIDAWAAFADLLRQIAPYYDPKALAEPPGS